MEYSSLERKEFLMSYDPPNTVYEAHSHCHYCGRALDCVPIVDGGKKCWRCHNGNYRNPTPVGVLIIPCDAGSTGREIIAVRRNIEPCRGQLALPGGFILSSETWQHGAVREAGEEVGCVIRDDPVEWPRHFYTESTPDGHHVIIVGTARAFYLGDWKPNHETQEVVRYHPDHPEKLCFPIHQKAVDKYFALHM